MNGYLVLVRCGFGDYPLRLCASLDDAVGFVGAQTPDGVRDFLVCRYHLACEETESFALAIVEFVGGEPMGSVDVWDSEQGTLVPTVADVEAAEKARGRKKGN
jgi:hypothetical protein